MKDELIKLLQEYSYIVDTDNHQNETWNKHIHIPTEKTIEGFLNFLKNKK